MENSCELLNRIRALMTQVCHSYLHGEYTITSENASLIFDDYYQGTNGMAYVNLQQGRQYRIVEDVHYLRYYGEGDAELDGLVLRLVRQFQEANQNLPLIFYHNENDDFIVVRVVILQEL